MATANRVEASVKGVIFTEFLEMVEQRFGNEVADRIIDESALASGGVYTAVGTYDHAELVQLVTVLSAWSNINANQLVRIFGEHLFTRFAHLYPRFFRDTDAFKFLEGIENVIHAEVLKLYPDAQLPRFEVERHPESLHMLYSSNRHFADLAEGLITGCIAHFGEPIECKREDLVHPGGGSKVLFVLKRVVQ